MSHLPQSPSDGSAAASPSRGVSPPAESPEIPRRSLDDPRALFSPDFEHTISSLDIPAIPRQKLQLRSPRSRGPQVSARNITPAHHVLSPTSSDTAHLDEPGLSHTVQATEHAPRPCRSYNDLGVLQEISNSSLRRRRNNGDMGDNDKSPGLRLRKSFDTLEDGIRSTSLLSLDSHRSQHENVLPRSIRAQRRSNTTAKRSTSGESSRYIEHLESQLASLQTQISAFTSPSEIQSQAARLRALNSETRLLRLEVAEWEQRFNDRLQEQMEHHNFVLKNLREYISKLENELEFGRERLRDYEAGEEDRTNSLEALEVANQDLERRLECMSELLATSPGKLDFYTDAQSFRGALKSIPQSSTTTLGSRPALAPHWRQHRQRYSVASPLSPTRRELRHQPHGSTATDATMSSTEPDSDVSEQTLVDPISPVGKRLSFVQTSLVEGESRHKPARRMRRFHVGSTGPRSLILPAANTAVACSASPPVSAPGTPAIYDDEVRASINALTIDTEMASTHSARPAHLLTLPTIDHCLLSSAPPQSINARVKRIRPSSCDISPNRTLWTELSQLDFEEGENQLSTSQPESPSSAISASSSKTLKHMGSPMPGASRSASGSRNVGHAVANKNGNRLHRIILAISNALDSYVVRAHQTFHNTWLTARLALRRPTIEFRLWLANILLGDMRRRRLIGPGSALRMHNERRGRHERTRSTGATIGLGIAPATASKGLLSSRSVPEFNPGAGKLGLLAGIVDHIGDDLSDEEDDLVVDLNPVGDSSDGSTAVIPNEVAQAPAMAWLKFSMTMVVAVGLAIKDGPGSLFALKGGLLSSREIVQQRG